MFVVEVVAQSELEMRFPSSFKQVGTNVCKLVELERLLFLFGRVWFFSRSVFCFGGCSVCVFVCVGFVGSLLTKLGKNPVTPGPTKGNHR